MKFKFVHPANCGFSPHRVYSKNEIRAILKDRTDELIKVLFEPVAEEKEVPTVKTKVENKKVNKRHRK